MYLDIHRHSNTKVKTDKILRNLFHSETGEIETTAYCSVGLHPWHVNEKTLANDLDLVQQAATKENVLAIGEAGIDKVIVTKLDIQRKAFLSQIEIAKEVNKPMIIHCVRAYDELLSFRKNSNHKKSWIIHWYNASKETGFDLVEKACYLSFGHMLFNESSKAFKTFLEIPLESIFLETDDADVTIEEVYKKAADLKEIKIVDLQKQINKNFFTCFGIEL
jgi:TatD DNase family protein